jgi:hypothetical protein
MVRFCGRFASLSHVMVTGYKNMDSCGAEAAATSAAATAVFL